jgi:hypothetical protein
MRSQTDIEAAALAELAERPDMSGAELGRRIGVPERTARRIRSRLATRESAGQPGALSCTLRAPTHDAPRQVLWPAGRILLAGSRCQRRARLGEGSTQRASSGGLAGLDG